MGVLVPGISRVRPMLRTARTSFRSPVSKTVTLQYPSPISAGARKMGPIVAAVPGGTRTGGAGFGGTGEGQAAAGHGSGSPLSSSTANAIRSVFWLTFTALQLKVSARSVMSKSLTLRGFINYDFAAQYYADFLREVGASIANGRIRYREDIVDGLENAPEAFIAMLDGRNFGKLIMRVAVDTV